MKNTAFIKFWWEGMTLFEYAPSSEKLSHPSCSDPIEAPDYTGA